MGIASTPVGRRAATRPWLAWARLVGGAGVLALLVWQVGTGPFLDGVRVVRGPALAMALGIGAVTTVCCAWRWRLVAGGLGVRLSLREAVTAYYGSQFLNTTLPGGVLGDVHRAVRHGVDVGDVGLGVRAVVLERVAGQTVQIGIAAVALCALPSPARPYLPVGAVAVAVAALVLLLAARTRPRSGRWSRALATLRAAVRDGLFARRNWITIGLTSAVAVVGHLATFLLAARTAGATAPLSRLLPLTLLALLAMAVPLNVAGWGPREGVAAWAFGAAGLTAAQGVATAVTFGVLVAVASLPGAAVLLLRWLGRSRAATPIPARVTAPDPPPPAVPALWQGGARG